MVVSDHASPVSSTTLSNLQHPASCEDGDKGARAHRPVFRGLTCFGTGGVYNPAPNSKPYKH